jgi:Tfp pilus assembly protein PilN
MKHINLLPKLKQRELAHERMFYSMSIAVVIAGVILLSGVGVQLIVWTYLNRTVVKINNDIEQLKRNANKSENAQVKLQIKNANAQIKDFTDLSSKTPQWATVLEAFMQDVPSGVKVTQLDGDATKAEITISGYSPTRDAVIELYNNINTDKDHFKSINYPLENVSQPTNVKFNFTFTVADGILSPASEEPAPADAAEPAAAEEGTDK